MHWISRCAIVSGAIAGVVVASSAGASERHFTYTYETGVLAPGDAELEPWTTLRAGRSRYYARFDQRLEYELGLAPGLQGALYWNFTTLAADVPDPTTGALVRERSSEFRSASLELKYELTDPVADLLGSALYLEGALGPVEAAVEGKLLLDKRLGRALFAVNLVGEYEREWEARGEVERELELEVDLGAGFFITDNALVGVEVRQVNELEDASELESSVFYAGPVVAFSTEHWWLATTGIVQLGALAGAEPSKSLDLEHQERFQWRLLLGFHL